MFFLLSHNPPNDLNIGHSYMWCVCCVIRDKKRSRSMTICDQLVLFPWIVWVAAIVGLLVVCCWFPSSQFMGTDYFYDISSLFLIQGKSGCLLMALTASYWIPLCAYLRFQCFPQPWKCTSLKPKNYLCFGYHCFYLYHSGRVWVVSRAVTEHDLILI